MIDTSNGFIKISDELTIFPGFSFEQFKQTKFYKNQDCARVIYIDEQQIIDNRKYLIELFFRNSDRKIYMVSLICDDKEFSEEDEYKREIFHNEILNELGLKRWMEFSWGEILSKYDARSNESTIDITYYSSSINNFR